MGLSLLVLGLAIWYPLRWWPGDRLYPVRQLNYVLPWLLVILLPALLLARLIGSRPGWQLMLAVPTLFISWPLLPLFLPRLGPSPGLSSPSFVVMSYSICSANRNGPAIVQVIRQVKPDLLLLQEVKPDMAEILKVELLGLYGTEDGEFHFDYASNIQQAIISRFPMTPLGRAPEQDAVQRVKVQTPGGAITVWNVHAHQPRFWTAHHRQLQALSDASRTVTGPLIVGGDFNTTPQSDLYRLMTQHLRNAHREAGWGFGFTFPASAAEFGCPLDIKLSFTRPVVRIDHIFYSHHFYAHQAGTLAESGGSDHLPVVAELSLEEK